ncbi:hypothetical protein THOG11_260035 [Vibrio harveyi]|nr:hypothetical protein ACOMICROBIO_NCLOACGD_00413 [Vibrio sp. B1ASS3]CAE6883262.1 hypothetical protein ACOMICROBIO_NCLOACGD_00413 [Vibrio sp. B1ASS3]CAH1218870.1 hypothetical protein TH15OA1_360016 [Vibrio harveyi]CAH1561827.1 hypothetical protein THOD03_280035 [Vibrio harveyi]CAH1568307.1 hypothetical protein THOG11_260035 [Vibrio harveyi]
MNLGNMAILNPWFSGSDVDKRLIEECVQGLVHSDNFVEFVLSISNDSRVQNVNFGNLIRETSVFEITGLLRVIELAMYCTAEDIFSMELISYLRLRR